MGALVEPVSAAHRDATDSRAGRENRPEPAANWKAHRDWFRAGVLAGAALDDCRTPALAGSRLGSSGDTFEKVRVAQGPGNIRFWLRQPYTQRGRIAEASLDSRGGGQ